MKLISVAAVLGAASLASACTIPSDWNRCVDLMLSLIIRLITYDKLSSVGTTIRSVARSRNASQRLMLALFEAGWVESQ